MISLVGSEASPKLEDDLLPINPLDDDVANGTGIPPKPDELGSRSRICRNGLGCCGRTKQFQRLVLGFASAFSRHHIRTDLGALHLLPLIASVVAFTFSWCCGTVEHGGSTLLEYQGGVRGCPLFAPESCQFLAFHLSPSRYPRVTSRFHHIMLL